MTPATLDISNRSSDSATMNLINVLKTSSWAGGFKTVKCAREGCSRWLTQRHLSIRRVGVTLRGAWYCCYHCFAPAAQEAMTQLMGNSLQPSKHNSRTSRMPLGLNMISRGMLNDDQFRKANEEHKKSGNEIGDIVVRFGYADEKQVTAVRAAQWGCPVFTVPAHPLAVSIHIPTELMKLYTMVPLHHVPNSRNLMVGFVQGVEYSPLYALEQITGCKTQPCFVTPTEFWNQFEAQRESIATDELSFDTVHSPSEMARIVCNYGALLDADEVAIVRCREYVWARLKGTAKSADLLFKVE